MNTFEPMQSGFGDQNKSSMQFLDQDSLEVISVLDLRVGDIVLAERRRARSHLPDGLYIMKSWGWGSYELGKRFYLAVFIGIITQKRCASGHLFRPWSHDPENAAGDAYFYAETLFENVKLPEPRSEILDKVSRKARCPARRSQWVIRCKA